ncbi:MAG: hypothetical protein JRN42_07185 [Nitrososphaerota archaeon]|nr:hypothetical protein [Nitrososphaerota archaeon]
MSLRKNADCEGGVQCKPADQAFEHGGEAYSISCRWIEKVVAGKDGAPEDGGCWMAECGCYRASAQDPMEAMEKVKESIRLCEKGGE